MPTRPLLHRRKACKPRHGTFSSTRLAIATWFWTNCNTANRLEKSHTAVRCVLPKRTGVRSDALDQVRWWPNSTPWSSIRTRPSDKSLDRSKPTLGTISSLWIAGPAFDDHEDLRRFSAGPAPDSTASFMCTKHLIPECRTWLRLEPVCHGRGCAPRRCYSKRNIPPLASIPLRRTPTTFISFSLSLSLINRVCYIIG